MADRLFPVPIQYREVGYLRGPFAEGEVPAGFLDRLTEVESTAFHVTTPGEHICEYCLPGLGDRERSARAGQMLRDG